MASKYIDVTGKTTDEAISKALAQLGLDRDDVSVEILEQGKKGFLGIGAVPAKVRVTYGLEEEEPPVRKAEPPRAEPVAARAEPPQRPARPPRMERPQRPARAERTEQPERPAKAEERPQRPARPPHRPERPVRPELSEHMEVPSVPAVQPEDLGEPCDDEKARKIVEFLTGLLQHMESNAQVKVYRPEEGRYKVILEGEKLGALIGRRGETLDAIQQLTSYCVNRSGEKRVRIHVDAENYRLKREQSLQNLARKVASKVLRNRRNVTLEPMNAYERHVIHTALQNMDHITTYSMGTDPNRRVIVAYDRTGGEQKRH